MSPYKHNLCSLYESTACICCLSLTLHPASVFVLFSLFCRSFCILQPWLWSDMKLPKTVQHKSTVCQSYSTESLGEGAWGHLVLFLDPNISLRLVLLQLRDIMAAQIIGALITVVLETTGLIKLIWPKDSSQTNAASLQVLLIKYASNRADSYF